MKMDMYCRDMWELLEVLQARGPERMFRNWQEGWENPTKNLGLMGYVILLEKLKRKYVGFKLSYNEGIVPKVYSVHSIMFQNMNCPRKYMIVGMKPEFDVTMDIEDNGSDTYNVWDYNADTYNCFCVYYDEFAEIDNVTVYKKGGVCNSEDEDANEE
jgi:hypothetical protein